MQTSNNPAQRPWSSDKTIVAIGKTGNGKSSTLNSIVKTVTNSNIDYFKPGEGPRSATSTVSHYEITPPNFPKCRLVDTIGLFDTELTSNSKEGMRLQNVSFLDEEHKHVLAQFNQVMEMCKDGGIDAFLFVVKASDRATKEAQETIEVIFRYLGWQLLEYVIFVVTGKDTASFQSFTVWSTKICEILEKNGYSAEQMCDRFVFVDNMNPCEEQTQDIFTLIKYVHDMNNGRPYTHAAFQQAQNALEIEKKKIKQKFQHELQAKIDEQVKPIREQHQRKMDDFQRKIKEAESAASELKEDQIQERKKFESEICALRNKQEDEKRSMEKEMKLAIKVLEQKNLDAYNEQLKQIRQDVEEMRKSQQQNMQQLMDAHQNFIRQQQVQPRSEKKPWYEVVVPIIPALIQAFRRK